MLRGVVDLRSLKNEHSISWCSDVASVDGLSMGGPGGGLSPAPSPLPNALNSFFNTIQNQASGVSYGGIIC